MQDEYEVFGAVGEHLLNRNPVCPLWPLRMNNESYIQSQSCMLLEEESHFSGIPQHFTAPSSIRCAWFDAQKVLVNRQKHPSGDSVCPVSRVELNLCRWSPLPCPKSSNNEARRDPNVLNKSHNSLPCSVTLDINNHPRAHEGVCFTVITPLSTEY